MQKNIRLCFLRFTDYDMKRNIDLLLFTHQNLDFIPTKAASNKPVSSVIIEVIRTVLIFFFFFFYDKILQVQKSIKSTKKH